MFRDSVGGLGSSHDIIIYDSGQHVHFHTFKEGPKLPKDREREQGNQGQTLWINDSGGSSLRVFVINEGYEPHSFNL